MKYPLPEDWSKWRISSDLHQFFSLHWDELLDEETTPDTWQVRSCNAKSIIREIIECSSAASSRGSYGKMIRSLIDELQATAKRDPVLKLKYPFTGPYIERLNRLSGKKDSAAEIGSLASVIHGLLDDYNDSCQSRIIELLTTNDKNNKKELYDTAMCTAVELVHAGYSTRYLAESYNQAVLTESTIDFLDRVKKYFAELKSEDKEYKCYFDTEGLRKSSNMSDLPTDVALIYAGTEKKDQEFKKLQAILAKDFSTSFAKGGIILKITVKSRDPISAGGIAEQRANQVLSNYRLFYVDRNINLKTEAYVVDCGETIRKYTRNRLSCKYLGTYQSRDQKTTKVMQFDKMGDGQRHANIDAAIQYHRLAMVSTSDEASFVNMWIALEALCLDITGGILTRVCKSVAPCVSLENVWKTVKMLARYLHQSPYDRAIYQELFQTEDDRPLDPNALLSILVLPKDSPRLLTLCKLCNNNPLLLHRLYRFRESTLLKPDGVANNLEITKRNVEWQLSRIYRLRNDIVHSGKGSRLIRQLFQHLHSYFNKTLMVILEDLISHPNWELRHSLEYRISLFDYIVEFHRKPKCSISVSTISDPANCLRPQLEPYAWLYSSPNHTQIEASALPVPELNQASRQNDGK